MDEDLGKSDFRGRRNINNKTVKRNSKHKFDDERDAHTRKEAGKKHHSRSNQVVLGTFDDDDYGDEMYADWIDPKLIK